MKFAGGGKAGHLIGISVQIKLSGARLFFQVVLGRERVEGDNAENAFGDHVGGGRLGAREIKIDEEIENIGGQGRGAICEDDEGELLLREAGDEIAEADGAAAVGKDWKSAVAIDFPAEAVVGWVAVVQFCGSERREFCGKEVVIFEGLIPFEEIIG